MKRKRAGKPKKEVRHEPMNQGEGGSLTAEVAVVVVAVVVMVTAISM
jgi:hypothetical protein